jgi:hypothetical protein
MTYDKACLELALSFLNDANVNSAQVPGLADILAQDIQRVIEDFIEEAEREPDVDRRWDEDQYLDDPRHGQAAGLNRENRGRS